MAEPIDFQLPEWFMGLIRCPNTGTELKLASRELVLRLQQRLNRGQLVTKLGRTFSGPLTQGLVSADERWFYPIDGTVVGLLPDEAVVISVPIDEGANP